MTTPEMNLLPCFLLLFPIQSERKPPMARTITQTLISLTQHTDKKQVPFEECFPAFNRHAITTTFLAMLQLVREHRVRFIQSSPYEDILIEKRQEKERREKGRGRGGREKRSGGEGEGERVCLT